MLFRRLSLARIFTVKQNRAKPSDTAIFLQQKLEFKSRQTSCFFREKAPLSKEHHFIGLLTLKHYRAFQNGQTAYFP